MVEQEAVNFEVAGSSPASRARIKTPVILQVFLFGDQRSEKKIL